MDEKQDKKTNSISDIAMAMTSSTDAFTQSLSASTGAFDFLEPLQNTLRQMPTLPSFTNEITALSGLYQSSAFNSLTAMSKIIADNQTSSIVELNKSLSGLTLNWQTSVGQSLSSGLVEQVRQMNQTFSKAATINMEPTLTSVISSLARDLSVPGAQLRDYLYDEHKDVCEAAEDILVRPAEPLSSEQWLEVGNSETTITATELLARLEDIFVMLLKAGTSEKALAIYGILLAIYGNDQLMGRDSAKTQTTAVIFQTNNYIDQSTKVEQKVVVNSKTIINFGIGKDEEEAPVCSTENQKIK